MLRNLIYHVTPIGSWMWNIKQLQKRIHHFNGKRICSIATANGFDSVDIVKKELPGFEFIVFENDKQQRETKIFPELLAKVESYKPNEITFFGHTKGVTHHGKPEIALWTELLYRHNLDRIPEIENLFKLFYTVGALKRYGVFHNFTAGSYWHYTGTFFWFKNCELFARDWQQVSPHRYGVEEYLSFLFHSHEAGCIFGDGVDNPYDLKCLKGLQ